MIVFDRVVEVVGVVITSLVAVEKKPVMLSGGVVGVVVRVEVGVGS